MGQDQSSAQHHHQHQMPPFYPGEGGSPNRRRPTSSSSPHHQQPMSSGRTPRPVNTEPGAFDVPGPQRQAGQIRAQVRIPAGVRPGQHFAVLLEGQQVMVRAPDRSSPGDLIAIEFQASTFIVQVPEGVHPGQTFDVMVRGVRQRVTCPEGVRPGMQIRFSLPPPASGGAGGPGGASGGSGAGGGGGTGAGPAAPEPTPFEKLYEVVVPQGVRPGEPFVLLADGQRVTVTCPVDARPNQKIRFKLPIVPTNEQLQAYEMRYNKDGWVRCLGVDLKFHWFKVDGSNRDLGTAAGGGGAAPSSATVPDSGKNKKKEGFSIENTAFVRAFKGTAPNQVLTLVPPSEMAIETTVEGTRINFHTLSRGAQLPFDKKVEFFRQQCNSIRVPWEKGHMEIRVRRSQLLSDSLMAFERISSENMRKIFRFEFLGEPAIDAGGVAREWYDQVTDALFNPDFGLFQYSGVDQMCMQINAGSGMVEQHHARYFRFLGRLLGKALLDGQIVRHHLVRPIMKHILGWPVVLADLEYLDAETLQNLGKLQDMDPSILEDLCLDFTHTENFLGQSQVVDLVPNGSNITLGPDNLDKYLEANLRFRLCDRVKVQLRELLLGFYEGVPEALLSIFDFQQLELLLCGMPNIDIADWMRHTEYGGEFSRQGASHRVVQWFWEVVRDDFDQEQRARLLQFTTGTSGVPAQGFGFLQGNDGNIRKFTINSIALEQSVFPRAHTCFNRIDLPLFKTKKDLKERLSLAIQMESTGFDIE